MNDEIKNVRKELHKAIENTESIQSEQVIQLSEKLDLLILEYYKNTMSFSLQMSGRN